MNIAKCKNCGTTLFIIEYPPKEKVMILGECIKIGGMKIKCSVCDKYYMPTKIV